MVPAISPLRLRGWLHLWITVLRAALLRLLVMAWVRLRWLEYLQRIPICLFTLRRLRRPPTANTRVAELPGMGMWPYLAWTLRAPGRTDNRRGAVPLRVSRPNGVVIWVLHRLCRSHACSPLAPPDTENQPYGQANHHETEDAGTYANANSCALSQWRGVIS